MRGKLLFIVGLSVGYVCGSKAGRKRYEQIKGFSEAVWNSAPVSALVGKCSQFTDEKIDFLRSRVTQRMKNSFLSRFAQQQSPPADSSNSPQI